MIISLLAHYERNAEWNLLDIYWTRHSVKYDCCPEKYADITFTLKIARRSLFYIINMILPMIIIHILTALSFYLPAESGKFVYSDRINNI